MKTKRIEGYIWASDMYVDEVPSKGVIYDNQTYFAPSWKTEECKCGCGEILEHGTILAATLSREFGQNKPLKVIIEVIDEGEKVER